MKLKNKFLCLLVLMLNMVTMSVHAGGNNHATHYGKVTVSTSGNGTVYIGTSNAATNGNTEETWNCNSNQNGDSKTFYLFAKPNDGYYFTGWTGDGTSTDYTYSVTIKAESASSDSPTSKSYTANFAELPNKDADMSSKIVNSEAEDDKNGWTGDFGILGGDGAHFFEPAGWWKTTEASMSQTVTGLPNGYYVLQMKYQAGEHVKVTLAGNTATNYVQGTNEGWKDMGVVCQVTNGTLNIKASSIATDGETQYTWFNTDHFTLKYYGNEEPDYTYRVGDKLEGAQISKPAYVSTPGDATVDPDHQNDALLVITYANNYTNDPKTAYKVADGAMATITADGGVNEEVPLIQEFRSSKYENGFALYIPNFDESKTYHVSVPAGSFGYIGSTGTTGTNEAFTIDAVVSPLRDGKYFVVVDGADGKHISRGGHYGTQAILDYYGVPLMVQTAGLSVFKYIDSNAFFGHDVDATDGLIFADKNGVTEAPKIRRYELIVKDENETDPTKMRFKFYSPLLNKYLGYEGDELKELEAEADGAWFKFEPLSEYNNHLAKIEEDEAIRVAARAGFVVNDKEEYDELIEKWETEGFNTIFPTNAEEENTAAEYHEKKNTDLACAADWAGTPRNLVTDAEGKDVHVQMTLNKGLHVMYCNAFQQAMALERLQQNGGFRGLTYMYVKVGSEMYKSQLKSITETTGTIPTNATSASSALEGDTYRNSVIFYVPADGTNVEFGVENPQRLGNGVDETAGSWVAFKNIKVEKFNAELAEANMKVAAGKYGTFIAPFAVKMPAGVTAYSGNLNSEQTSVALTSVAGEGTELEACTPVVIYNAGEKDVNMDYREVDVRNDKTTVSEKKGVFVGFYKSYADDNKALIDGANGTSWVLQTQNGKQAFYKVDPAKTFKGSKNRCYMVAPAEASVKMLSLEFSDEDGDEDIETIIVEMENDITDAAIYDLSGRKVSKAMKGIYVKNGKKFIVK